MLNDRIVQNQLDRRIHHKALQRFLADRFKTAMCLSLAFGLSALIVVISGSHVACATFAGHQGAAFAAEQFGGQEVVDLLFGRAAMGDLVLCETFLHPVKQILVHNGGHATGDHNVLVAVLPNVAAILEDLEEAILDKRLPGTGAQAAFVQGSRYLFGWFAVGVAGENLLHDGGGLGVDVIEAILFTDDIAQRHHTAVVLALKGVLSFPAGHLDGQLRRIIFGHANEQTLDHDALRAVRDRLHDRDEMDAVLFKLTFVVDCIVTVAGKAVQFPDQDCVKDFPGTVLNHPLELGTVVGLGRVGPVDVGAHDGDTVALGVVFAVPQLAFNGGLALAVRGVAGVDDSGHGGASLRLNVKRQAFV